MEPAVEDFDARHYAENEVITRYVRAMNDKQNARCRRWLAPVRQAACDLSKTEVFIYEHLL